MIIYKIAIYDKIKTFRLAVAIAVGAERRWRDRRSHWGSTDWGGTVSTQTLSEVVYDRLRLDIRSGILAPGRPLRMEWLKATYGIGATPLREALSRLSAEHLVTLQGGRGFRVAEISLKEFDELVALREDLEYRALKEALVHGDDAWETNIVACYYSLSKLPWHVVNNDARKQEQREVRHRAFHSAVVAACGSTWLMRLRDQLSAHEERYRRIAMHGGGWSKSVSREVEREHRQIMDAAIERDLDRAWAILQKHRWRTCAAVRSLFADAAPAGEDAVGGFRRAG